MKSIGCMLLILVSLITLRPSNRIVEIPVAKVSNNYNEDSLNIILQHKITQYEGEKKELIELQKQIGVRK